MSPISNTLLSLSKEASDQSSCVAIDDKMCDKHVESNLRPHTNGVVDTFKYLGTFFDSNTDYRYMAN